MLYDENHIAMHCLESRDAWSTISKELALKMMQEMLLIRRLEMAGEAAYLNGDVGGFFHSYIGQEAVQTAIVNVFGKDHWYTTSYRCHALALLLGVSPDAILAELYGKATGNAKGRGGSMHLFHDNLLGGHGIVGGQFAVAAGAGFSAKYKKEDRLSICFFGDGALAQGTFHETLNIVSLWNLPCIYVLENNSFGMGTATKRAIANDQKFLEKQAESFAMPFFRLDGMDIANCYAGFTKVYELIKKEKKPVLIECLTSRFRGHSISDPGLYRSKEELASCKKRDPILLFKTKLIEKGHLTEDQYKEMERDAKEKIQKSMQFAAESPFPDPTELEQDVLIEEGV